MSEEFKPIETQEELDKIITNRLKRERESAENRFKGWISPEDHQKGIEEANKAFIDYKEAHKNDEQTIADLTAKVKTYETASLKSRIAHEVGLSYDWISRISGEDEESIRADAESLKKLVGAGTVLVPTKSTESGESTDPTKTAMKSLLGAIKTN